MVVIMKPIRLIIEGFNSFIEKQVIDFERITPYGIFGIFGPTGSGKSSILDAITFSLFGKIDRGDGVFVNTNCKTAYVSFSFKVKDDMYEIERTINSKDGSYKTKSLKMLKNDEVIGHKDREIEKILYDDVLGLTFDDFVTSVVLPQGKFSEFLMTSPKDRRELIERLFDLKRYGTDLSFKIKKFKDALEIDYAKVQGEFKTFDGLDEEELKKMRDTYEEKLLQREKIKEEVVKFNEEYLIWQNIWTMCNESKSLNKDLSSLLSDNSDIDGEEKRLNDYKLIKDFLVIKKQVVSESKEIESLKIERENKEKEINKLNKDIDANNLKYEELSNKRLVDIPNLNKEMEDINKEMLRLGEKEALNLKLKELKGNLDKTLKDLNKLEKQNKTYIEKIQEINEELSQDELKLKENEVDEGFLNRILKGAEIEKNTYRLLKSLNDSKKYLSSLKDNNEKLKLDLLNFEKENGDIKASLEKNEKEIYDLDKNIELGRDNINSLVNENNFLLSVKDKWDKILKDAKINEGKRRKKEKELSDLLVKKEELDEKLKTLEELKKENSANEAIKVLLPILKAEERCPLCGSLGPFHEIEIKDVSFDDGELKEKMNGLNKINNQILVNTTQAASLEEEFLKLKEELDGFSLEYASFEKLSERISNQDEAIEKIKSDNIEHQKKRSESSNLNLILKRSYEKSASDLHETKGMVKSNLDEINFKEKEIENLSLEYDLSFKDHEKEKEFFNDDSLEKLKDTTLEKDKLCRELRRGMSNKNSSLNGFVSKKNDINERINEIKLSSLRLSDEIEYTTKSFTAIALTLKFEDKNQILNKLQFIKDTIDKIEKDYAIVGRQLKEFENLKQDKIAQFENLKGMIIAKGNLLEASVSSLHVNLDRLNLGYDIEKYELKKDEEIYLEKKISEFKKKQEALKQKIATIEDKLKGETLDEKEWNELNEKKENLEQLKAKIEEETGALKKEIEIKTANLLRAKELKKTLDKLTKRKGIVEEIQSITKGNSIMDFVALKELKYISNIASNTLSNITGTRYNIVIDETGEFMIRDLLNGGEKRKIRSLSGGELFLTSLSMALALSSHIQLKGKMNLEFFFLDEGFGTLDKDSLEIVLKALEKIKNNNLTIGIISHLKEVQERMPIKIMLTPANSDHGSIVKIV